LEWKGMALIDIRYGTQTAHTRPGPPLQISGGVSFSSICWNWVNLWGVFSLSGACILCGSLAVFLV
jgi:hypothetical protein